MSQKGAQRTAKTILKVVPVKGVFRTLTGTARFDQLWIQSDPNGDPFAPIGVQSEPNGDQIFQSLLLVNLSFFVWPRASG